MMLYLFCIVLNCFFSSSTFQFFFFFFLVVIVTLFVLLTLLLLKCQSNANLKQHVSFVFVLLLMSIDKFHQCLVAKCELHKQNVKCQIHVSTFKELLEKLEINALVPCTAIILIPNFSKKIGNR